MKNRKAASRDFSIYDLPKTRKEQFSDILKHHYFLLLKLGFILLLCAIPLLISMAIKDINYLSIIREKITDAQEVYNRKFTSTLIFSICEIVSFIILGIGLSGTNKIVKELIYNQPVFFKEDFKEGIKTNFKSTAVICLVVGIFTAISNIFYLAMPVDALKYLPFAINYGIIYPICFVSLFLTSVYSNKILVTIKTSLIIYIKFFPVVFGTFILFAGIAMIKWIPVSLFYLKYILLIIFIVFHHPVVILGSFLYQMWIYDENINKTQFIEFYKKGLFVPEPKVNEKKK